jgi:hypothetical protein
MGEKYVGTNRNSCSKGAAQNEINFLIKEEEMPRGRQQIG